MASEESFRRGRTRPGRRASDAPTSRATSTESDSAEQGREDFVAKAARQAPPWLISAIVHMAVLIAMGLLILSPHVRQAVMIEATTYADKPGEQLEFDSPLAGDDTDEVQDPILTPEDLAKVDDPFAAPLKIDVQLDGVTASSQIDASQIGLALKGREPGMKRGLLAKYGGQGTQRAVEVGLKWLVRNQDKQTGSWSLKGPYSGGGPYESRAAATAMALLAFQGDGHTRHSKGPYQENVKRGWDFLLAQQDADGCFYRGDGFNFRFYAQAQCAIAICELYAMSHQDPTLRKPAENAIGYLLKSQSPKGGWKYQPNGSSDVSVTGWVVMALQSARMAGIEISSDHFRQIEKFLDSTASEGGSRYGYEPGHMATPSMTAEALLCRQYLGWKRDDPRLIRGVEWITSPENLINYDTNRNLYCWYYAAQVAHHMEGEYWRRWNVKMAKELPAHQVKRGGETGSWDPSRDDNYDRIGGRLYVTCLTLYMLEVYYRHLPLYSNVFADQALSSPLKPAEPEN